MKLWFERGAWVSRRARTTIASIQPEDVRRIAVVRHAALGDMVLIRPFLIEARKFFPKAEIILSTVSNYTYGTPEDLVDSVHVLHGNDRDVTIKERFKNARALGSVDILFDLADTTRSRYLTLLTKAKIKIGFPYRGYLRNLLFDAAVFRSDFAFEADAMLDTLKLLGANPSVPLNFGWPSVVEKKICQERVPTIVYFPFASVPSKCWPGEFFMELINQMSLDFPQHSHLVLGGIGARENSSEFVTLASQRKNVTLQQAMDLTATIKFLSAVDLVVSNDTGIRNLAITTNTPTLGVFFSTVPHRYWPRRDGRHDAVFISDGRIPPVEMVRDRAQSLLSLLGAN